MPTAKALSPLESAFLHVEADGTPMHMASIGIFEGEPLKDAEGELRLDDLRQLISSRLHLVPKLRQRARPGLLHEAPPTWNDDPDFDICAHVRHARLGEPGDEEQLLSLCGELLAAPLDSSRPLWELTFVSGLEDSNVAVVEKLHHAMADGIAAAELATILLDLSPVVRPPRDTTWSPEPPPSAVGVVRRDLQRLLELPLRLPEWLSRGVLHPLQRTRSFWRLTRASEALLPTHVFAPSSALNRPNGPRREVNLVRMDLHAIRETAHRHGATINDVVLTIVSGGLHSLLAARGELEGSPELQALVPVGLEVGSARQMGNAVSALFVRLPVHEGNPTAALASIASTTAAQKRTHQELAPAMALRFLDPVPQSALAQGARLLRHQPLFNLIVTNVPGPNVPLYALGARMLEAFPIVPLVGNQGLGVAALSYVDQLNLGVLSDPEVCADAKIFCDGAVTTFRRLTDP
jgi:diacylglycerol O-acyltransferase / wax synthase